MRKSIRGAFLRELTAFFIVPFVLILTILGTYIVITVKSDAEHQTRVMESMIANEINTEIEKYKVIVETAAMQEAVQSLDYTVAEPYIRLKALKYLDRGRVVIFGGGTGKPYFTTDTCATLRAIENKCDAIFVAKNGVDGIYSDDPRINKNATMYKTIKCSEIIAKDLKVMDLTAIKMLVDQDIDVRVFNMNDISNFYKIAKGEDIGTTILKG